MCIPRAAMAAAFVVMASALAGCEFKNDPATDSNDAPRPTPLTATTDDASVAILSAIASAARPAGDRAEDAWRNPAVILTFLQVRPGMRVLDAFAGGGYYTELLSDIVGDGAVLAYNNKAYADYEAKSIEARFAGGRLPNVKRIDVEAQDLKLVRGELDAAIFIRAYHDTYWGEKEKWAPVDHAKLLKEVYEGLKPGGVVVVQDHVANPGGDPTAVVNQLHRIDPDVVKRDFLAAGFVLDAESNALRNAADDHSLPVFDERIRHHTDDMLLRFLKPLPAANDNASSSPE